MFSRFIICTMKLNSFLLYLLFTPILGFAQITLQTNPNNIKWQQIDTENFRVIYPNNAAIIAQQTAKRLSQLYLPDAKSLGVKPTKISIIVQNQTTVSNGFVTLAPRRSEFFVTPPQNPTLLGTSNWIDLLAIHEYRHIVQFERSKVGFTRLVSTLFGPNSLGGLNAITPN